MGAIEFEPLMVKESGSYDVELSNLVEVTKALLEKKETIQFRTSRKMEDVMMDILKMGTSAGGARPKAIIAIQDEKRFLLLYNPVITMHSLTYYDTEEGCLSLAGKRPCRRYDWVEVKYEDEDFHKKRKRFQGFTAEIIQHEIDHLEGILI